LNDATTYVGEHWKTFDDADDDDGHVVAELTGSNGMKLTV
jgi:hypothetical protein